MIHLKNHSVKWTMHWTEKMTEEETVTGVEIKIRKIHRHSGVDSSGGLDSASNPNSNVCSSVHRELSIISVEHFWIFPGR